MQINDDAPYEMFVSFNNYMTGSTSGAGAGYSSRTPKITYIFFVGSVLLKSLVFCLVFCGSVFVLLSFIFWPLHCLSFFKLQLLIWYPQNFSYLLLYYKTKHNGPDLICTYLK